MRDCCEEISSTSGERFASDPCEWSIEERYWRPCKTPARDEEWYWRQSFLGEKTFIPSLGDIGRGWAGRRGDRQFWIRYYAMWLRHLGDTAKEAM